MLTAAFLIERMNYYRLLVPIVDRALQDGGKLNVDVTTVNHVMELRAVNPQTSKQHRPSYMGSLGT